MADINTRIRLSATDDASAKISQVKKNLAGLLSSQGMAGNILGGAVAGGVMGLTAGLMDAIPAMGQAAWDMGVMAAQAERTEASFASLADRAGISGQAMLQAMRSASQGTVADVDLMAAANRGLVLGVADSAAEMADLVEAAIIRGRDVGVGATQAVNDLVTGIGRMSPEILDNLGIANASGAFKEYAAQLGTTADKLTEVQKKQALVNAVLASTEGVSLMDDAASSFERMDVAIKKMQGALGELFGPAIAAVAQQLADAVDGVNDAIDAGQLQEQQSALFQLGGTLTGLADSYGVAITAMQDAAIAANGPGLKAAADQAEMLMMSMEAVAAEYNKAAAVTGAPLIDVAALKAGEIAFLDAAAAASDLGAAGSLAAGGMSIAESQAERLRGALTALAGQSDAAGASLRNAFLNAAAALGATGALSGFQAKQKELNLLRQEWQYMGLTAEQIAFREQEFLGLTTDALRDQISAMNDLGGAAGRAASGGVSALDAAFGSLRSRVESMLSGSLSPDVSIPEGLIPRADDINENARRLAAIANEGIGDQSWMEEFKAEVPGIFDEIVNAANPQAAAARIFTEFQAGLRPELIDRSLVKERIKAMITGEQEMSALASEIAQELAAEMGLSLPQALAAAQNALGVKPTGNTDQFGSGFEEGIDAQATAAGSLAKIAKAFLENESNVRASGGVVGAWWGEGFMAVVGDNVPPGLLDMLTSKLLPLILAGIAQRNSTTGTSDGN